MWKILFPMVQLHKQFLTSNLQEFPIDDIISFIREHIDHIDSMDIVVSGEQQKQLIWNELKYNCDEIYITSSVSQLIEISHKDAGKHSGLRFIREYLNLKPEETAAFGDGDNDIDLLKRSWYRNCHGKCFFKM